MPEGDARQGDMQAWCLAVFTYACELGTLLATGAYVWVELAQPWSTNGFCLPYLETHLWCCLYDIGVAAWYLTYAYTTDRFTWSTGLAGGALWLHWISHYDLYELTKHGTLTYANHFRHFSFALVLVGVNTMYCLPRLLLLPPWAVSKRTVPSEVVSSLGIALLMVCAELEYHACKPLMAEFGGHVMYDVLISAVAALHLVTLPSRELGMEYKYIIC